SRPTTSRIVRSLSGIVPWTASPSRVTSRYDSFFVVKPRVTSHRSSPWWKATRTYPFGRQMSASFTLWMSVRVVLPYKAKVIASRIEDFPAPVRPVITVYFSGNRRGGTVVSRYRMKPRISISARMKPSGSADVGRESREDLLRDVVPHADRRLDLVHRPCGELDEGPVTLRADREESFRVEPFPPVDPLRRARVDDLPADRLVHVDVPEHDE